MIQPGTGNEVQKRCTNNPLQSDSDGSECKYIFSRCDSPSPSKKRPRVEQERSGREGRTSIHIQWASFFAQTIHATGPPSRHGAGVPCEIDASGRKNENNRLTTGANSCNHRLSLCLSLSLSSPRVVFLACVFFRPPPFHRYSCFFAKGVCGISGCVKHAG